MSTTVQLLLVAGLVIGGGLGYVFQASRSFDRRFGPDARPKAEPPAR